MVRTRSRYILIVSTLLRRDGLRIGTGYAPAFLKRLARVELPTALREEIAPLLLLLQSLNAQIITGRLRFAVALARATAKGRTSTWTPSSGQPPVMPLT
jgi:hypothetical protein